MMEVPNVILYCIVKNDMFVLKDDYILTINNELARYLPLANYKNIAELIVEQAQVLLAFLNDQEENKMKEISSEISEWIDEKQNVLLYVTLKYADG